MSNTVFKISFLIIICTIFIGSIYIFNSYAELNEINNSNEELAYQIDKSNKEIEELKNDISYQDTNEFVEKIARENLGFVRNDEFVFKTR